jgi:hypothetical protein
MPMVPGSNGLYGNITPYPVGDADYDMKQFRDFYEVYVNDEFIGNKVLVLENEDIHDVEGFLNSRGFKDYDTELDGIRFFIRTDDSYQAQVMKDNLHVYLQIR